MASSNAMAAPSSSGTRRDSPSTSTGSFVFQDTAESEDFPMSAWLHYDSPPASPLLPPASPAFEAKPIDKVVVKSELTSSPDFRTSRLPSTVPVATNTSLKLNPKVAISAYNNTTSTPVCQDVHSVVKTSASSSPVPRSFGNPSSPLETSVSSFSQPSNHVLTSPNQRLRTPNQVFSTSSDLAAHYGIPQILPPAPRPSTRQTPSIHSVISEFDALKSTYLTMLSTNPTDNNSMTADDKTASLPAVPPEEAQAPISQSDYEDLVNFLASPAFNDDLAYNTTTDSFDMEEYLTSPLPSLMDDFDSPYETPYNDFLTTPVIPADDTLLTGTSDYASLPLFGGINYETPVAKEPIKSAEPHIDLDNLDKLYTISPGTPPLHSASLYTSPRLPEDRSSFPSPAPSTTSGTASRRRSNATGTRKGVTPDSLVSLEAPTQSRKYVTPSVTSRKELPAVFARKRARSQAFGDEEDELAGEDPLGPNATEKEQIEWKRRQNTLAARKSRKRKLQHQQELEDAVKRLTSEREVWKTRALTFQQLLVSHGIPFNKFQD